MDSTDAGLIAVFLTRYSWHGDGEMYYSEARSVPESVGLSVIGTAVRKPWVTISGTCDREEFVERLDAVAHGYELFDEPLEATGTGGSDDE